MPHYFQIDPSENHFNQPRQTDGESEVDFGGFKWKVVQIFDGYIRIERQTSAGRTLHKYVELQGDDYVEIDVDNYD